MRGLISRLLLVTLALSSGCALYSRRLEVGSVGRLKQGQTTRTEAEKILGEPRYLFVDASGALSRHWFMEWQSSRDASWHHRRWEPGSILSRTLTLQFNDQGILVRKLHDESVTPVFRTNAWLFVGPELAQTSRSFVAGVTSESELIRKMGEPTVKTFDREGRPQRVWIKGSVRQKSFDEPNVEVLRITLDEQNMIFDWALERNPPAGFDPFKRR